ncbi:hypothetical protein HR11_08555 [Porphyromonas macacae]|uniref:glycosyltransferase family 4 protein n=1 Tax=Porphyromonas macacae TaxID=28115 RepID=UPI00052CBB82|nr:glycosyltransferase family 4 protein [Porphyromonas macacae]KGN98573.1 hypothetical protein HR11_08555 [Porphyromonas macacae]
MKNTILHIANDFPGSKVYSSLIKSLNKYGNKQIIYTAFRDKGLIGGNRENIDKGIEIKYRHILNIYTRINFYAKRRIVFHDLKNLIPLPEITLTHAHTWYSDGAIALKIYQEYKIPYVVTIRNTDINLYYKRMLHLRKLGESILINSKRIIFISKSYQDKLFRMMKDSPILQKIKEKSFVIPNGVDSFWLENFYKKHSYKHSPFRLIYVGKFDRGKNLNRVLAALAMLNNKTTGGVDFHLTIIGGDADNKLYGKKIRKSLEKAPKYISFIGKITNKNILLEKYREADAFIMPSLAETFGLVYIEAMSQGLPVLYSIEEGIDGYFTDKHGCRVNPFKIQSIMDGIEALKENYYSYEINFSYLRNNFDWDQIAKRYIEEIYTGL